MQIKRAKYGELEKFPEFGLKKEFKSDFFGSSPAPFVGRFGYPHVNVGILSPQFLGETDIYNDPKTWSSKSFPIQKIADMRFELVNSRQGFNVYGDKGKLLEICKEIGMAAKPVELEINLEKKPVLNMELEGEVTPFGPRGKVKKAKITSNPKINQQVEKVVSDTDLKSIQGIWSLYQKGFDENFLTKLISVGNLGLKKNRKLVPTRWSITAIDDTLGKKLWEEVKSFPLGDYSFYFGGDWGNYYLVLFFPEVWSYELFESYIDYKVNPWSKAGNFYSTDHEDYSGRKDYAEECAGGYYACRLGVLEKMKELKRQHSALVLRFITSEYGIPLGVWVCREATRKSLTEKPLSFGSQELMLKYAKEFIKNKFGFDLDLLLSNSVLLKKLKDQTKLAKFF